MVRERGEAKVLSWSERGEAKVLLWYVREGEAKVYGHEWRQT